MPDYSPEFSPETEHLKIDNDAHDTLVKKGFDEVIRCLFINESPYDLTMKEVRDYIRVFAGANLEPWIREMGVIKRKSPGGNPEADDLRTEYRQMIRIVRQCVKTQMVGAEKRVWQDARARLVDEANYAVFRVTRSRVFLHRLTNHKRYENYGQHNIVVERDREFRDRRPA